MAADKWTSESADVLTLLKRDVQATLGNAHSDLIERVAADVRELQIDDEAEQVVNDVQQHFHDTFADPKWPACPRHPNHPLWFNDGSWWCVQDGVAIARLGALSDSL